MKTQRSKPLNYRSKVMGSPRLELGHHKILVPKTSASTKIPPRAQKQYIKPFFVLSGTNGVRTRDLRIDNPVLSQLSYGTKNYRRYWARTSDRLDVSEMLYQLS